MCYGLRHGYCHYHYHYHHHYYYHYHYHHHHYHYHMEVVTVTGIWHLVCSKHQSGVDFRSGASYRDWPSCVLKTPVHRTIPQPKPK